MKRLIKYSIVRLKQLLNFFRVALNVISRKNKKTIWVFGSPNHSNLGDQAQTYCIERWANENYPKHSVFIFIQFVSKLDYLLLKVLRKIIGKDDILICHSGYHMTELYPLHKIYSAVACEFLDFPLVIFPQTVNFSSIEEGMRVAKIFDSHPNCTLLCRDAVSFETAKQLFKKTKLLLYPDVVTTMIGKYTFSYKRKGVLCCMRNDKEAFYTAEQILKLRERIVSELNEIADIGDTTICRSAKEIISDRKKVLEEYWDNFAHYKVIITDRYHGTIFSLIAGTPVVVIGSTDHKLSSGVKWFPKEIFSDYVSFAQNLEEAFEMAKERIKNPPQNSLPPYFVTEYYFKLRDRLEF